VSPRVALALSPELERAGVPGRTRLGVGSPPYSGEDREEQYGAQRGPLAIGQSASLCGLRRAWQFVGVIIDPGDAAGVGLVWTLRVINAGLDGFTVPTPIVTLGGTQAFLGIVLGARCELIVANATAAPVNGLRGSIWGMTQGG
jgi:hypothetical protein